MLHEPVILALGMPSPIEWIAIAALGLLFFGKRLPEVGRSIGRSIVEFKKGLRGIDEDIDQQVEAEQKAKQQAQFDAPSKAALPDAYKFDPYTGQPIAQSTESVAPQTRKPGFKFDPYTGQPIENNA